MKSKQVWMKSKSSTLMKLNPSLYPCVSKISPRSDFICVADLSRRKTDLVEKDLNFLSKQNHQFDEIVLFVHDEIQTCLDEIVREASNFIV